MTTEPGGVPEAVVVSGAVLVRLVELLDHCHSFLDSNPTARVELAEYCYPRPGVTAYAMVDQLAWQSLYLRTRLAEETRP